MDKILITGSNGLLGTALLKQLHDKNFFVIAASKSHNRNDIDEPHYNYCELDIANEQNWMDVLTVERPDIIIHAGAMTQVDECELNRDKCYDINYKGTVYGLRAAEKFSKHFIYVSTDFVFDGLKGSYKEEDDCAPVNWYGHCKLLAESVISGAEIPWAIVRTCLVYGKKTTGGRDNIITWIKSKLEAGEKIKVVNDQWRTPTYIGDLANGIISIAEKRARGVFHISGKDLLTPYQMAIETARYLGLDESLIEKVNADTFTQPAKRPLKTGFIIEKAVKELGYSPVSFIEGIKKVMTLKFF